MDRRGAAAFAVGAVLVLSLAGMVVTLTAVGAATSADRSPDLDGFGLACEWDASAASFSSDSTSDDRDGAYRELTTCATTELRTGGNSRNERSSEADLQSERRLHRWRCPICGETKTSFSTPGRDTIEEASNNLRSHVRTSDGQGHGPPGTVPDVIAPGDLDEHVTEFELTG